MDSPPLHPPNFKLLARTLYHTYIIMCLKQEVFFITEQDKQAWGGCTIEMVSHSTVNVTHELLLCVEVDLEWL